MIEIRSIRDDELVEYLRIGSLGFLEEHRPGALATLEGWLRTPDEPSCSTFF